MAGLSGRDGVGRIEFVRPSALGSLLSIVSGETANATALGLYARLLS